MEAPAIPQPWAASLERVLLLKLDRESTAATVAAVREEVATEVYEQAMAEARTALEDEFATRRERLLDQLAQDKKQIEKDADARADVEVAAAIKDQEQDWADRLDTLRSRVREARERAQTAKSLVVSLLT